MVRVDCNESMNYHGSLLKPDDKNLKNEETYNHNVIDDNVNREFKGTVGWFFQLS